MLRDISWGMQGPDVASVQEALELQKIPLPHGPLVPKGVFGPKTDAAVRAFQALKHLGIDGIVGPKTRAALYPYGALVSTMKVQKTAGRAVAASHGQVLPSSHPTGPVKLTKFPGLSIDLPSPLVIPVVPPTLTSSVSTPPSTKKTSLKFQIKAGDQLSYRLQQSPTPSKPSSPWTDALVLDLVGMIYTPDFAFGRLHGPASQGFDLTLSDQVYGPTKYTATISYAVTLAPELFHYGKWQLLGLSAKAGVGMVAQDSSPKSYFNASASLAAAVSYSLVSSSKEGDPALLKIVFQGGPSLSLDHRNSEVNVTTTLPAYLGIQGNF